MSTIGLGLALLALGGAQVDGTVLPHQMVHLRPGDVVTIRLSAGTEPKWLIASNGRTSGQATANERAATEFLMQQEPKFKPGQIVPPAMMHGDDKGFRHDVMTKPAEAPVPENYAPAAEGAGAVPIPIAPDVVKLTLKPAPIPPGMILTVENGYAHMLRYKAVIHRLGRREPTDVCDVLDNLSSIEHWPYDFDSIDLSAFEITAKTRADGVGCQ